jgi:hypothetical protein
VVKSDAVKESERLRRAAEERAAERVQPLAEEVAALARQRDSAGSNLTDLRRQLGLVSGEEEPTLSQSASSYDSPSSASSYDSPSASAYDSPPMESVYASPSALGAFDPPSTGTGFDSPSSSGVFESESAPLQINKQRDGSDIDRTQQLPVVR